MKAYWRADRQRWVVRIRKGGKARKVYLKAASKAQAEATGRAIQAAIDRESLRDAPIATAGTKLADVVDGWITRRAQQGIRTAATQRGHLVHHILPRMGAMPVSEIHAQHVVELVDDLRAAGKAARTVRNIHTTGRALWNYLYKRKIVPANPWDATREDLPRLVDSDPAWRLEATFERSEVELLISAPEIPQDRRVMNGLLFLAGMRIGEAAGLRWKHYDPTDKPLGRFTLAHSYEGPSKTDRARFTPVHPVLAAMLAEWRLAWPETFGRAPTPDDFIVPGPPGPMWHGNRYYFRFHDDLRALGLRVKAGAKKTRSPHSGRGTFLSLGVEDGAALELLERATHTATKGSTAQRHYLRVAWPLLCREVAKIRIRRPGASVPMVAVGGGGGDEDACPQACPQGDLEAGNDTNGANGATRGLEMTAQSATGTHARAGARLRLPPPAPSEKPNPRSNLRALPRPPENGGGTLGAQRRRRGAANPAFRQSLYDQLEAALGAGDLERAKHIARRLKAGEARL